MFLNISPSVYRVLGFTFKLELIPFRFFFALKYHWACI